MYSGTGDPMDDGFQSGDEDKVDLICSQIEEIKSPEITVSQHMIKYVPPPQQIKDKPYSLHPDMLTGWMPKVQLPKPVPLTFPQYHIAQLLSPYFRQKPSGIELIYLGPRFNNTYSAWKVYGVQFPYNHIGYQRVVISDRQFQGMIHNYPKNEVRFESQFESGNLDAVFKVDQREFDCFMRIDANTRGHLQWYYFKMFNLKRNQVYKLNICNFRKGKTLYNRGMKPYIYSHRRSEEEKIGWKQQGQNIQYVNKKSKTYRVINAKQEQQEDKFYTLSFELQTEYEGDIIQIAYCPPYSYTKLTHYLKYLNGVNNERNILHEESLCLSLSGFKIPLLTLTNDAKEVQAQFKQGKVYKDKHLIFVMSRIHPGQSNGSYVMEGFLNWLCGFTKEAEQLRSKYVFKIVPMVNPDGVVIGNYRTGLSGRDFNRQFIDPDPAMFVEVFNLKKYMQKCKWIYQKSFNFFLDFHGHSVKKNAFAYGPQFPLTHSKYYESRLLPKLISKQINIFRYYSCVFNIAPGKKTTARAILLRQFGVPFSYTIQASNGSYFDYEVKDRLPFNIQKWNLLGVKICESLFDYWTIYKQLEEVRQKKKKQRQTFLKSKGSASRKIYSSSFRSKTANFDKASKINFKSVSSKADSRGNNILSQILTEITHQNVKEDDKCSDDLLSEGKSDSQNSEDDIDLSSMKSILTGKPNGSVVHKMRRVKTIKEESKSMIEVQTKPQKQKMVRHSSSFLTEFEDESPEPTRRHPFLQRRKKPCIQKKVFTMSGSSVSPPNSRTNKDTNGTAKIINLNFMLNPIPISSQFIACNEKKPQKTKTQTNEEEQKYFSRSQFPENARKTYLSLQRDSMKKETGKRMSINGSLNMASVQFKNQEVIGRRIFTQT